ncbi:MAG: flagellar basal body rod protein FlgC [Planctomycetes bacterium]|nr:flagellar basal body rod protein FlgC [Planctomycetota bacterium]
MTAIGPMDIAAAGLKAQRTRMTIIANNIANQHTTRNSFGEVMPYRRQKAVFSNGEATSKLGFRRGDHFWGVHVAKVKGDPSDLPKVFDPSHPDADENGYVTMPNVNIEVEMMDMLSASRAYQANIAAIEVTKEMYGSAARIIA